MGLYTGNILDSYEFTELPIDNYVIEQVNQLFSNEKYSLGKDEYPMFEWAPGIPILYDTQEEVPDMID